MHVHVHYQQIHNLFVRALGTIRKRVHCELLRSVSPQVKIYFIFTDNAEIRKNENLSNR